MVFASFAWVLWTCLLFQNGVGRKDVRKFLAVKTPGIPGSLLVMIQLHFYLIYILRFLCQIAFKERVCHEKKKDTDDL